MSDNIQVIIPSRKRTFNMQKCLNFLPFANILVHQSQYQDYIKYVPKEHLKTHTCSTLAQIRRFAVQSSDADCVVQIDDDLHNFISLTGQKIITYTDGASAMQVFQNSYNICKDLGIKMFGYNMTPKPLYYLPCNPIALNETAVCCFGTLDKNLVPDQNLTFIEDTDVSLQCLYKNRIIYIDKRFCFVATQKYNSPGGNCEKRRQDMIEHDNKYLKQKWGKYYTSNINGNDLRCSINVTRKNKMTKRD